MTQREKRQYLIQELLRERPEYAAVAVPEGKEDQKRLLRSLFNLRMPGPVSSLFLEIQDEYLQEETRRKSITRLADLDPVEEGVYLWQGDITTLECHAIVNAANSQMLGCFCPCHGCIDNVIHTYSGIQLRAACAKLMEKQGHKEETGKAKITPAFNLPCEYVLHTVGPVVRGRVTQRDREQLASCYRSCLEVAEKNGIKSVAFCCISTGEFHFPGDQAAEIAVRTVKAYKTRTNRQIEVIFNVFKETDLRIYQKLLSTSGVDKA